MHTVYRHTKAPDDRLSLERGRTLDKVNVRDTIRCAGLQIHVLSMGFV
jgi:hypothetical protein